MDRFKSVETTPEPANVRVRRRRPWWRRRRGRRRARRLALLAGALFLVALATDAVLAARQAARGLEGARSYLEQAADRLVRGQLGAARASFDRAEKAGADATGALRRPGPFLLGSLPRLGDDVRAARALGEASVLLSQAGGHVVEAAGAVGWDGEQVPGIRPGGVVDLALLERAQPGLTAAAQRFQQASAVLDTVPSEGLHPRIADALQQARGALQEQARVVIAGAQLTRLLPSFLGAEEPRRYFLAIQNLSAPRGSGGFLGHYGILKTEDGRIRLGGLAPVQTLGRVPPVSASPDVEARYARLGGVTHFIAANYSPDFPTSAQVLLDMWKRKTGERLDGVIAVDSVWMSYVLEAIGPVRTPAWPEPLTAENIDRIVNRDTFLLPQPLSNQAQSAIGAALWKAILTEPPPTRGFGAAMARSLRERHLQIYVPNPEEQDALRRLGAGGELRLGRFPLLVVWQDAVNNRAGYFAEKSVTHRITLEADGSAEVLTEVTLENTAPDHPPSILLGDGKTGDPVGYFAAFVNVYLPEGATDVEAEASEGPTLGLIEEEFGHGVVTELLGAPSGGTTTLRVEYRVPDAAGADEKGLFLQVIPQPALRPDLITVDLRTPLAAEILGVRGLDTSGISARYVGRPQVPVPLAIRYVLSGG